MTPPPNRPTQEVIVGNRKIGEIVYIRPTEVKLPEAARTRSGNYDADGGFSPDSEQEEFLRSWVIETLEQGNDGISDSEYADLEADYKQWVVVRDLLEAAQEGQGVLL